jgi:tripartite-type tricarboxylate transporter receptor subunit TctC
MIEIIRRLRAAALDTILVALLCCVAAAAAGQDYPNKPIRFVLGQPAGGPTDIVARLIGQKLSERLGQSVVVENRPGAGSNIGTEIVLKAPKDGYTLLVGTVQQIVNPYLFDGLAWDPLRDLAPVSLITKAHIVLVTNPDTPAKNLKELIDLAKSNAGKLSWASAGNGSTGHLALELFKSSAGVDATHVPYKGTQPALTDMLGGRVPVMFDGVITSLPHIRTGKLRPIAVASLTRSQLLPDVPTMTEAGLPGFETVGLATLMAPAGTPSDIVHKLSMEIAAIVRMPDVRDQLVGMGLEVVGSTPAEFTEYIRAESKKWGKVIRDAKIKAE